MKLAPHTWPIRVRLTALYASAFLTAGLVLIVFTYFLVADSLFVPGGLRSDRFPEGLPAETRGIPVESVRAALLDYRERTLDRLVLWSIVSLAVALGLAVLLGWVLAGRALSPLKRVTATARKVASTSLHERIGLTGPNDEVKELADMLDAMLERLDGAFDAQRRFVANVSHELRTPLAVNRTVLEVALGRPGLPDSSRDLATSVLETNARSERLVEALLALAAAEQPVTEPTPVDLAEIADAVCDQEAAAARQAGLTLERSTEPAHVSGNGMLLERLLSNLVQNAIRHGDPTEPALLKTGTAGEVAYVEIANAGPVVRAYEVESLFEPFSRGKQRIADGGVGLGLSIVRAVAHGHGGSARARPRNDGGLIVRIELPVAAS